MLGDVAGAQGGARQFDHGADQIFRLHAGFAIHVIGDRFDPHFQDRALSRWPTSGIMISGTGRRFPFPPRLRLEDRARLHLGRFPGR
jgi:hypothetical protein